MRKYLWSEKANKIKKLKLPKYSIFYGSVRSGKTILACFLWLYKIMHLENSYLHLMGGVSSTTSFENNVVNVLEMCDYFGFRYALKKSEWKIEIYSLGGAKQTVLIRGFNNKLTTAKIKGFTLQSALLDELCELDYDGVKMLETRLTDKDSFMIATTNPPPKMSWLDNEYINNPKKNKHKNYLFQHFQLKDNITLTDEYLEDLDNLHDRNSYFYKMYILGLITSAEGVVYTAFDENKHVQDLSNFIKEYYRYSVQYCIGIDYNAAIQHTAYLTTYYRGKYNIISECIVEAKDNDLTDEKFMKAIEEKFLFQMSEVNIDSVLFITPHDATSLKNSLFSKGYNVMSYMPDVLNDVMTINSYLHRGLISIDSSCEGLIKEFYNYVWDSKKAEIGITYPSKDYDCHSLDAIRGCIIKGNSYRKGYLEPEEKIDNPFAPKEYEKNFVSDHVGAWK